MQVWVKQDVEVRVTKTAKGILGKPNVMKIELPIRAFRIGSNPISLIL